MAATTRNDCGGVQIYTATVDLAAHSANDSQSDTVTVTGVKADDIILAVIPPSSLDDDVVISHAYVSAANTVVIVSGNVGAGTPNVASGTWTFAVCRR